MKSVRFYFLIVKSYKLIHNTLFSFAGKQV